MLERGMLLIHDVWKVGFIGKVVVVYLVLIALAAVSAAIIYCVVVVDRRYARRYRKTGTVMRKYIEFCDEYRCYEVHDSPEVRTKGVCFMIDVWCTCEATFRQAVREDLYDTLKEGNQLPVEYAVGRIFGGVKLIKMPVTAKEWEKEIDEAIAMGQLSKQW